MADRFFQNAMPDFVPENPNLIEEEARENQGRVQIHSQGTRDSLMRFLSLPYSSLSQQLQRAALDLKETIVVETWGLSGQKVDDFSLYAGTLGTAYLLFKSFLVTHNKNDLSLCLEIVKACDSSSTRSRDFSAFLVFVLILEKLKAILLDSEMGFGGLCNALISRCNADARDVTFICGRAGVCAVGAMAAKHMGDDKLFNYYLSQFKEIKLSRDHPDELLYGRAGYLWTCLFLNKHFGKGTIPATTTGAVVKEIIKKGRKLGRNGECPLMFEWYGERYWGAAHGLAGIMHVLMEFELASDELEDVKGTLKYMITNRSPSGNYPASEEDKKQDALVHWCHGAPGLALTLVRAAEVFGEREFIQAAMDAAEVVWNRGLLKRVGICHGISGNAYVFLALYRLTGIIEYLYRAKAFACFLLDRAHMLMSTGEMHGGDHPFSLFEGVGGMALLFLDMVQPKSARFPAYEL